MLLIKKKQKKKSVEKGYIQEAWWSLIAAKQGLSISQCNLDDGDLEILWCRMDQPNEKPIH